MGTLVNKDCTSKLTITSCSVTDSKETIFNKCLAFFTKDEVLPMRGEMMEMNLARWYVGEPIADTMGLSGLSDLCIFGKRGALQRLGVSLASCQWLFPCGAVSKLL